MKQLHVDFAPRSVWRTIARIGRMSWAVGGIGFLLCLSAAITAFHLSKQHDAEEVELQRLQTELAKRTAPKPAPKRIAIPDAQASAINSAIAQLNLPWRDVFDAVESGTPATIALLALEPDAKKHLVRGLAEAKSSDGMIAYIEQLKQQTFFGAVILTKHEINEQDPNQPIRFQFEAQWTEAAQ